MTVAAARVETKIILSGSGDAAKVVGEVNARLVGLGKTAAAVASKSTSSFSAFASDLASGAGNGISDLGGALGQVGKAAGLLPGPLGLAAAATVGLAIAAFELKKHFDEIAAKVAVLGDASTKGLADRLKLSVDEAIKLQQVFEDLPAALRPNEALLGVIRQRAESIGKDGGAAVTAFVAALAKGPGELRAFEQEFGRLAAASSKLPDLAARLGLSREALGIATELASAGEKAKTAAEQAVLLARQHEALQVASAAAEVAAANASSRKFVEMTKQSALLHEQTTAAGVLVQKAVDEANALQAVVVAQKAAADAAKERAGAAALGAAKVADLEALAAVQETKALGIKVQSRALQARGAEVTRRENELREAANRGLVTETELRLGLLQLGTEDLRNFAAKKALAKQQASDASAAGAKARQARDAELQAEIKVAKLKADALDASAASPGATAARRRQLALEESAEVGAASRAVNTARGRALAIRAVETDFAAKRMALDAAIAANGQKLEDENRAILEAGFAKSAAIAAKTADAVAAATSKGSAGLAATLRARGDDERADLVERQQAWADYGAEVARVNRELQPQLDAAAVGSTDRANLERQGLEASAAAWDAYNDKISAVTRETSGRLRENIAAAVEAIRAPAELLASSGGPGAKLGKALAATAEGTAKVARGWKEAGGNSAAVIGAVGQVAAAFVDGERQKAAILAITEAAAAVASYPNVPAMIAHGAAAVLYGAAAGGFIGGASGGAPSIPSAGDLADRASPGDGAGAPGGGGNVVNVYFGRGFVVGTPQQVGAAVNGAVNSLKGTGLKAGKGV